MQIIFFTWIFFSVGCDQKYSSHCYPTHLKNEKKHLKTLQEKNFFTRDILAHNILIKRYCNKKILLSHGFQWLTKVSSQPNTKYLDLWFVKSLPWPIEVNASKISFYRNLFFIAILCVKMSHVNKFIWAPTFLEWGQNWKSYYILYLLSN